LTFTSVFTTPGTSPLLAITIYILFKVIATLANSKDFTTCITKFFGGSWLIAIANAQLKDMSPGTHELKIIPECFRNARRRGKINKFTI